MLLISRLILERCWELAASSCTYELCVSVSSSLGSPRCLCLTLSWKTSCALQSPITEQYLSVPFILFATSATNLFLTPERSYCSDSIFLLRLSVCKNTFAPEQSPSVSICWSGASVAASVCEREGGRRGRSPDSGSVCVPPLLTAPLSCCDKQYAPSSVDESFLGTIARPIAQATHFTS